MTHLRTGTRKINFKDYTTYRGIIQVFENEKYLYSIMTKIDRTDTAHALEDAMLEAFKLKQQNNTPTTIH